MLLLSAVFVLSSSDSILVHHPGVLGCVRRHHLPLKRPQFRSDG